ncbi:hypothetical protein CPter291_2993 [Collimonas pratensis]|uniref:Uncharacterized protein n=1 Tax=Collimonas pratensis TaxID=279113 RepID=A0ABM5Z8B2_9BURK|nr:hypothetical protein CPter291_2993 [Collimonas pratensis]
MGQLSEAAKQGKAIGYADPVKKAANFSGFFVACGYSGRN